MRKRYNGGISRSVFFCRVSDFSKIDPRSTLILIFKQLFKFMKNSNTKIESF